MAEAYRPDPLSPTGVNTLSILFYSILFYSILFYSILFYSILFYYSVYLLMTALSMKHNVMITFLFWNLSYTCHYKKSYVSLEEHKAHWLPLHCGPKCEENTFPEISRWFSIFSLSKSREKDLLSLVIKSYVYIFPEFSRFFHRNLNSPEFNWDFDNIYNSLSFPDWRSLCFRNYYSAEDH